MELYLTCRNQTLTMKPSGKLVEKSMNYIICVFDFQTDDWDGTLKTAVFENVNGDKYEKLIVDGICKVPYEVTQESGKIKISAYGTKEDYRITSGIVTHKFDSTLFDGNTPTDPEQTVYEQILSELAKIGATSQIELQKSETAIQWRYTGEETWKDLVQLADITGPAGADGQPGTDGAPGQDGADGKDGITPHIGANGNWYIGDTDTGVKAEAPSTDSTLTESGKAADAAETGRKIGELKIDLAAITPDDNAVDGKPWTSKKTVDSLCMPIAATGNPVQVYPVDGYPLGVVSRIDATQSGTGDASPDNIRPIVGWDSVSLNRCGKNFVRLKSEHNVGNTYTINGVDYTVNTDYSITAKGTATRDSFFNFTPYNGNVFGISTTTHNAQDNVKNINGFTFKDVCVQYTGTITLYYIYIPKGKTLDRVFYPQVEIGSTATPYEPYTGDTYTAELPETIYGGELDWNTGVLTVDRRITIADGTVNNFTPSANGTFWNMPVKTAPGIVKVNNVENSHFIKSKFGGNEDKSFIYTMPVLMEGLFNTIDDLNAYLIEQNAAGTPLTFVYELKTPYTVQLSPQQIAALSGVNTLYTDAGTLTVTGREDPRHTIVELKNAIISLGGNI